MFNGQQPGVQGFGTLPGITFQQPGELPGITFQPPLFILPGAGPPPEGYTIVEYEPPGAQPPGGAQPPAPPPAGNGGAAPAEGGITYIDLPFFGRVGIIGQQPGGGVGQAMVQLTFPPGILFGGVLFVPLVPLLPILPTIVIPLPAAGTPVESVG